METAKGLGAAAAFFTLAIALGVLTLGMLGCTPGSKESNVVIRADKVTITPASGWSKDTKASPIDADASAIKYEQARRRLLSGN